MLVQRRRPPTASSGASSAASTVRSTATANRTLSSNRAKTTMKTEQTELRKSEQRINNASVPECRNIPSDAPGAAAADADESPSPSADVQPIEEPIDRSASPQTVKKFVDKVDQFIWHTFQWRQPNVSVLYVLAVNVSFWLCVFYVDMQTQLYSLFSVAAFILCLEVLHIAVMLPRAITTYIRDAKMGVCELRAASDWVARARVLLPALLTARPVRFLLRPVTSECCRLLRWKADHVLIGGLCAVAFHSLDTGQREQAGWCAYSAVLTLLIAPAWRAQGVTWAIRVAVVATALCIYNTVCLCVRTLVHVCVRSVLIVYNLVLTFLCATRDLIHAFLLAVYNSIVATVTFVHNTVVTVCSFVYRTACFVFDWVSYIVLLKWVPPLVSFVVTQLELAYIWLNTRIIQPVYQFSYRVFCAVRYVVLGYWIPPLYRRIRDFIVSWIDYFIERARQLHQGCVDRKNACVLYVRTKRDDSVNAVQTAYTNTRLWVRQQWLMPIGEHYKQLKLLAIYIFCGHWIKPLLSTLYSTFVQPCVDFGLYVKQLSLHYYELARQWAVYIFYGYWVRDLYQILSDKARKLSEYLKETVVTPCIGWLRVQWEHLKQTARATRDYCVQLYLWAVSYTKEQLSRFKLWLLATIKHICSQLAQFFVHSVALPALVALKEQSKAAMVYSKENVLQPLVEQLKLATCELCVLWHENVIVPLWLYVEVHMKRIKHQLWVHYIQPSCIWLQHKLPDPGDAELKEFFPEEIEREGSGKQLDQWSSSRQSEADEHTGYTPALSSRQSRQGSVQGESQDEDVDSGDEFTSGLSFGGKALVDSDSSDEEFSLRNVVKHRRVMPDRTGAARHRHGHREHTPNRDGHWSDDGSTSSVTDSLSLISSIRDSSVAEDPPPPSRTPVLAARPPLPPNVSSTMMMSQRAAAEPAVTRRDSEDDPPSTASNPPSWSETLLQAYKKTNRTPTNTRRGIPAAAMPARNKDDEFELLDADS